MRSNQFIRIDDVAKRLGHLDAVFTKNHTLVEQLLKWFIIVYNTTVSEYLVPETGIQQMQYSMFCTTDIQVYRHPVFNQLRIRKSFAVMRIKISQEVPAGTCPLWHCICFALSFYTINFNIEPFRCIGKRRFTIFTGLIVCYCRQFQWQIICGNSLHRTIFHMDDRDWFTPVTLS